MSQAGIHAIAVLGISKLFPKEKWLYTSIVFGAILPDIDSILVAIATIFTNIENPIDFFHRTFTHSFFTCLIIYLTFAVFSEIKNNSTLKIIGKGIVIGMLSHIVIDTFIWFRSIHFLWPLPVQHFNLWNWLIIPESIHQYLMAFEFIFFRLYGYLLIKIILLNPIGHTWFIKPLSIWMRIELWLFFIFIAIVYSQTHLFTTLFGIAYIPSLIMALISTYLGRFSIEAFCVESNQKGVSGN